MARFMAKSLYILKMDLMKKQISFLSQQQKENISQLASFVGVYFSSWFLRCAIAPDAPYLTLLSFKQMLDYSEYDPGLAFTVLDSILKHTWYLTEEWVVACLVDDNCPEKERKAVARSLHKTPRADQFEPQKPNLPVEFWPKSGKMTSLSTLVGPRSWLLPHLLGLSAEDMAWLNLDIQHWSLTSGFQRFSAIIKKMLVVNDPAERGVKLVQDFIDTTQDEGLRQWRMLSAADQRKKYSKEMTKEEMKKLRA